MSEAMTEKQKRMCVLLPCAEQLRWIVPQACLAEILTVPEAGEEPPVEVSWRGVDVPVLDFGADSGPAWCNRQSGSGLIAVILGVRGEGAEYWSVALRGNGLAVRNVEDKDCQEEPDAIADNASGALSIDGTIYQVPDLPALQRLSVDPEAAVPA